MVTFFLFPWMNCVWLLMGVFDFLVLFDNYWACFSLKIILKWFGYDGNKSKRYEQEDYVGSSDNVQKNTKRALVLVIVIALWHSQPLLQQKKCYAFAYFIICLIKRSNGLYEKGVGYILVWNANLDFSRHSNFNILSATNVLPALIKPSCWSFHTLLCLITLFCFFCFVL